MNAGRSAGRNGSAAESAGLQNNVGFNGRIAARVTYAQRMSGALERAGISARVLRPPVGLTDRGCGYAVRVAAPYFSMAMERLRSGGPLPERVFYSAGSGAYSEVMLS